MVALKCDVFLNSEDRRHMQTTFYICQKKSTEYQG